jgi:hypothetical protein
VRFRERYGYLPRHAERHCPDPERTRGLVLGNGEQRQRWPDRCRDEVACVEPSFQRRLHQGRHRPDTLSQSDRLITIRAIARSASGVTTFATSTRNVIEVLNLSCRSAQELDAKSDDGNFASGNTRASVASCVEGGTNDPVPSMAVGL